MKQTSVNYLAALHNVSSMKPSVPQ